MRPLVYRKLPLKLESRGAQESNANQGRKGEVASCWLNMKLSPKSGSKMLAFSIEVSPSTFSHRTLTSSPFCGSDEGGIPGGSAQD